MGANSDLLLAFFMERPENLLLKKKMKAKYNRPIPKNNSVEVHKKAVSTFEEFTNGSK